MFFPDLPSAPRIFRVLKPGGARVRRLGKKRAAFFTTTQASF